jgi:thiamine pyrophosphate-dependent acetolactate synthase large subunit-like protein
MSQTQKQTMSRFECMQLLGARLENELVILSLGGAVDEWYNAAPHMRDASLFQQQLGCVTPEAFGLAVGLPNRRIVSLDTDGGLLFNLGILATLGNERPANLFIVVWDNEQYQSIGGPATHTASGRVDLAAIARGAGVENAFTVRTLEEFDAHCAAGLVADEPYIVVAKTDGILQPGIRRKHSDGREDKYIFVRHVEKTEGITIMGPSEHN